MVEISPQSRKWLIYRPGPSRNALQLRRHFSPLRWPCHTLEELVHRPAALILHVLEHVSVAPEGHGRVGVALSPICPDVRDPVGVNRGVKSPADPRKPFIYRPGGQGRPVSRILLYPVIHLRGIAPGPLRDRAYQPDGSAGTFWLARTGRLPGRSLAGYRRWALTPPFHPSPVPGGEAPWCFSTGHRLVCSLLHLT